MLLAPISTLFQRKAVTENVGCLGRLQDALAASAMQPNTACETAALVAAHLRTREPLQSLVRRRQPRVCDDHESGERAGAQVACDAGVMIQ